MTVDEALTHAQKATAYGCSHDDQHCMRVLGNEVGRLHDEAECRKHGFCWGTTAGVVYGSDEACKELAAKFEELKMYQHAIGPLQQALERIAAALERAHPEPSAEEAAARARLKALMESRR